ncbi:AAA-like domain-containing protein [Nostoc sp.]|uniref:AAA-like domain-containing protein n=1 Tax=Nostoc sp. TaxID=1180 RepID=UPI002FFC6785
MIDKHANEYIFSGTLPGNASTYVIRLADNELLDALQKGTFCYVLNSRQTGKSSLRVRTMNRLLSDGVECTCIDLSSIDIQSATQEKWYADLIVKLIDNFDLDINFKEWWSNNQFNSSLLKFGNFIENKLLAQVQKNIVIFIDEIDSVLNLNFPTDDFFAFIRSCYNQRPDNPEYNRLTFCLLGVASPSNLIEDKQRTPFNIGKAISLTGFQLHEVEPLEKGLYQRYSDAHGVMKEILYWTGGQPFLTQKLCQFMVEESFQDNYRSVEQVVKSHFIENWESQDEPEHLRTIRARILRDEKRAAYLLELYQKIRQTEEQSEIIADNTLEQSELQLSGLVVKQHNKLRVYNPIYQEVFDFSWIENQLKNLRPYSESFKFWVTSGETDDSRLLRGLALQEAFEWAIDKNLSYQDKQYLAASKEKEIQEAIIAKEQEAALERERKDREAAEQRNQALSKANKKAQQKITFGFIILFITVLGAVTVCLKSINLNTENEKLKEDIDAVQELNHQAANLQKNANSNRENFINYNEDIRRSALSFNINDHELQKALIFATHSQVEQQLGLPKAKAYQKINEAQKLLLKVDKKALNSPYGLQAQVLIHSFQGKLLSQKKETYKKAIESYSIAFDILRHHRQETGFPMYNQLLTNENVESVYRELIYLYYNDRTYLEKRKEVEKFITKHLYDQVESLLKVKQWSLANEQTFKLMSNIAKDSQRGDYLDSKTVNSFSCPDLRQINNLWLQNSNNFYGFSVQEEIWMNTIGSKQYIEPNEGKDSQRFFKDYLRFAEVVGWKVEEEAKEVTALGTGMWRANPKIKGSLPSPTFYGAFNIPPAFDLERPISLALRLKKCQLNNWHNEMILPPMGDHLPVPDQNRRGILMICPTKTKCKRG